MQNVYPSEVLDGFTPLLKVKIDVKTKKWLYNIKGQRDKYYIIYIFIIYL